MCHFGVPDWIGNFQNPDFPDLFTTYAEAFAQRFSLGPALYANQRDVHLRRNSRPHMAGGTNSSGSDQAFVTALKHIVKANVLAMRAHSQGSSRRTLYPKRVHGNFHAENPAAIKPAEIMNARRFLSLDLNYGRRVNSGNVRILHG